MYEYKAPEFTDSREEAVLKTVQLSSDKPKAFVVDMEQVVNLRFTALEDLPALAEAVGTLLEAPTKVKENIDSICKIVRNGYILTLESVFASGLFDIVWRVLTGSFQLSVRAAALDLLQSFSMQDIPCGCPIISPDICGVLINAFACEEEEMNKLCRIHIDSAENKPEVMCNISSVVTMYNFLRDSTAQATFCELLLASNIMEVLHARLTQYSSRQVLKWTIEFLVAFIEASSIHFPQMMASFVPIVAPLIRLLAQLPDVADLAYEPMYRLLMTSKECIEEAQNEGIEQAIVNKLSDAPRFAKSMRCLRIFCPRIDGFYASMEFVGQILDMMGYLDHEGLQELFSFVVQGLEDGSFTLDIPRLIFEVTKVFHAGKFREKIECTKLLAKLLVGAPSTGNEEYVVMFSEMIDSVDIATLQIILEQLARWAEDPNIMAVLESEDIVKTLEDMQDGKPEIIVAKIQLLLSAIYANQSFA